MNGGIHLVDHYIQVFRFINEIVAVHIHDQHFSKLVGFNPGLVSFIQPFQVIQADVILILPSPFLYLPYKGRNRSPQVYNQVGGCMRELSILNRVK